MYFYKIWVGSPKLHAITPLTYTSNTELSVGQLVSVPLRHQSSMGFVHEISEGLSGSKKVKLINDSTATILPEKSRQLHEWMRAYYPAPCGMITNLFLPSSLPKDKAREVDANTTTSTTLPPLTKDQTRALTQINSSKHGTILLHGATGTGKTRIYLELAKQSLKINKSVIVLTPEIGLTPQLLKSFTEVFPAQVIVIHSNLTAAKRRDTWYTVANAEQPLVIIGPRSALFAPLPKIGLVVIDEAHDQAYKQEQTPYYQANRVGPKLAHLHQALCVLGTATPSITDYYLLGKKQIPIVRMQQLASGKVEEPKISIVDLKDREELAHSPMISKSLAKAIENHIATRQQALLFLNRRGSARVILCQSCGWQAVCPTCDISLVYHDDQHRLRCHTCGFSQALLTRCPDCQSSDIIYHTPGTKSLEQEAKRLFPELRIQRFDSDNLADEKLEKHFTQLVDGAVDIIIGTQLVTKGLDLPNLGVVGIINADTSLNFPDFTAEEKTFQQLSQVIGRVGRHQKPSTIVIQTYNPQSPLLSQVTTKDWVGFLDQQLTARQQFGFPPFNQLLQLKVTRATRASAQTAALKLISDILSQKKHIVVRGPSPQLHEKIRGKYHWQIIVSSKQRQELLNIIEELPSGWQYNIDPTNLM